MGRRRAGDRFVPGRRGREGSEAQDRLTDLAIAVLDALEHDEWIGRIVGVTNQV
jgi:hypothetical protein